jgi:hypothetical protein
MFAGVFLSEELASNSTVRIIGTWVSIHNLRRFHKARNMKAAGEVFLP